MDKIIESIKRQEAGDDAMTAALRALGKYDWEGALRSAHAVLACSESIEQRLAAVTLATVASGRRELEVTQLLSIIYDYE